MDKSKNKEFLVLHDYGQGGVWVLISAVDESEILSTLNEVEIIPERPDWLVKEYYDQLERFDIGSVSETSFGCLLK